MTSKGATVYQLLETPGIASLTNMTQTRTILRDVWWQQVIILIVQMPSDFWPCKYSLAQLCHHLPHSFIYLSNHFFIHWPTKIFVQYLPCTRHCAGGSDKISVSELHLVGPSWDFFALTLRSLLPKCEDSVFLVADRAAGWDHH